MSHRNSSMADVNMFRADVLTGLSQSQKTVPCRWLYDEKGAEFFDRITQLDEYYLTRTELSILKSNLEGIAEFMGKGVPIVEYGAGSGLKSELVLGAVMPEEYFPVDISESFLATVAERIRERYSSIQVTPIVGNFMADLPLLACPAVRRTAFFPGSTVGNLNDAEVDAFLHRMREHTLDGGRALIGFDLCQCSDVLLPAYNDSEQVTAAFNLNILERINRELGADFCIDNFAHEARWNEYISAIEMHLVSRIRQRVHISDSVFLFEVGETIITEWSRKFALNDIAALTERNGWRLARTWQDPDCRFVLAGLEKYS